LPETHIACLGMKFFFINGIEAMKHAPVLGISTSTYSLQPIDVYLNLKSALLRSQGNGPRNPNGK
jgi:hypothetical protein